jgi:hypothetical protein
MVTRKRITFKLVKESLPPKGMFNTRKQVTDALVCNLEKSLGQGLTPKQIDTVTRHLGCKL